MATKLNIGENGRFGTDLTALSDLFFNYEHPAYDGTSPHVGDESERAALTKDAADFRTTALLAVAEVAGMPFGHDAIPTAEQFADDFLARL